jgi:hypothetical protein
MHRSPRLFGVFLCFLLTASFGASEHANIAQTSRQPLSFLHAITETQSTDILPATLGATGWKTIPRGGGWIIPAGYNPFGFKITELGEAFLKYDGSLDCDVGRFLASLKSGRKRMTELKAQWLEVVRVSKTGQTMRVYRQLQELLDFCLKAGLID